MCSTEWYHAGDLLQERFRTRGLAIEHQCPFGLASCAVLVTILEERFAKSDTGIGTVATPDRDLEIVDRFRQPPATLINAAEQQMRLVLIRREIDRAPQGRGRLAIVLRVEQ